MLIGNAMGEADGTEGSVYSARNAGALDHETSLLDKETACFTAVSAEGCTYG